MRSPFSFRDLQSLLVNGSALSAAPTHRTHRRYRKHSPREIRTSLQRVILWIVRLSLQRVPITLSRYIGFHLHSPSTMCSVHDSVNFSSYEATCQTDVRWFSRNSDRKPFLREYLTLIWEQQLSTWSRNMFDRMYRKLLQPLDVTKCFSLFQVMHDRQSNRHCYL